MLAALVPIACDDHEGGRDGALSEAKKEAHSAYGTKVI